MLEPMLSVLLPVGLGVVGGIVIVGNAVQWMLNHRRQATLGFLLGLLLGSIAGLWPFQESVQPRPGDWLKGQIVTAENIADFDAEDWNTQFFQPTLTQVGVAALLILVGAGITLAVARLGRDESEDSRLSHREIHNPT